MLRDVLQGGIERGDVRPDLDPQLAIDVLKAMYAWNYRLAACRQATAAELSAMMDKQIHVHRPGLAGELKPSPREREGARRAAVGG